MPVVRPLKDELIGDSSSALVFLLIGGVVLLFVAWANVGTLCLARAERLHEEVAVARAIGATQWHLARRFCVEALALGGVAGLLAFGLARTAIDLRFGFEFGSIPRLHEVTMDEGVVAGLLCLTAVSAATVALITYARVRYATTGSPLHLTLGRSSPGRRAHASRRALVAAQVAMAVPLVVGSALMAESYWRLSRVELGFHAPDALTFALEVPPDAFRTSGDYYRDVAEVHDRVRRGLLDLPGVRSVESATRLPLSPDVIYYQVRALPDREAPALPEPYTALFSMTTPGYFEAMGIPLLSGRTFLAEDTDANIPGAVLSASLARALFGEQDPMGRQIRWPGNSRYPPLWVVGVVGDVPAISIPEGPSAMLYLPNIYPPIAPQMMDVSIYIPDSQSYVVHATTPAAVLVPEVRRVVQEVDATLFVREPGSMAQHVGRSTARTRLTLWLLAVGSGTALFLGMVGLYAVLSHAVGRRRTEFGIRMVVGAEARDLTRGVVAEGVITALAGIAFGLIIARGTSELLRGLIYGVSPGSPETFIAVSLVLLGVAAGASYVPARRAARLDPVAVLKAE
jgi:predicted permease